MNIRLLVAIRSFADCALMYSFVIILSMCLALPQLALADNQSQPSLAMHDDAHVKTLQTTDYSAVGSNLTPIGESARNVAKGLAYAIAVLALITTAFSRLRKKCGTSGESQIAITCRMPIGPRSALLLVEVKGQSYLISNTADSINLIADLSQTTTFSQTIHDLITDSSAFAPANAQLANSKAKG